MLQPERYSLDEIRAIQRACCHVFLNDKALHSVVVSENNRRRFSYPFLERLTFEEVRRAYRANVLTYHPDRHQDKQPEEIELFVRHLEGVNQSYEYLCAFFGEKKAGSIQEYTGRVRIIAVGGAKGGIGKSILAANLGMMLSSRGFRTVMVDLDLGGSDLHIYLGHRRIPKTTLNDYLNRKVTHLSDVVIGQEQGPMLIAGDNGELGAANIPFQRKIRLIEGIRKMNADYVILDLGGGTDFNTLDFFLAADLQIVLTTLDQPSYLEAYAFIKTAMQRKLTRLFSADSTFPAKRDTALKDIVCESIHVPQEDLPRTIQDLLERVAIEHPLSLPLIADEVLNFSPCLVINKCFDEQAAFRMACTLRSVARRRLSIDINHIGSISRHPVIEQSTSYINHPLVTRQSSAKFAGEIESIIETLSLAG
ncbi:MAG: AAA family ATPase [Desulfomonilia bacterium]|jgi:flagellar biosynthesis protein FlhG